MSKHKAADIPGINSVFHVFSSRFTLQYSCETLTGCESAVSKVPSNRKALKTFPVVIIIIIVI